MYLFRLGFLLFVLQAILVEMTEFKLNFDEFLYFLLIKFIYV
jgi:hypothetical protein